MKLRKHWRPSAAGGLYYRKAHYIHPILYRLEDDGYLDAKRIRVGKRMTRVYYRISENGQEYYAALLEDYNSIHTGVQLILSRSNEENEK